MSEEDRIARQMDRAGISEGTQGRDLRDVLAQWRDRAGCEVTERWAVIRGELEGVLPLLPDLAVDHVITDPPYSEHVHANASAGGRRELRDGNGRMSLAAISRTVDLGFDPLTPALRLAVSCQLYRLVRRWSLVFSDPESAHLWRETMELSGMGYGRLCFWDKIGGTPQFTGDRPAAACEGITAMHRKKCGRWRWNGGGKRGLYSFPIVANRSGHRDDRVHTTQKPYDLMAALVADFTDHDDLILDPFAGSGTTGVAALRLGRRAILIEKDPKYAALCVERMRAEESGSTLRARRAGQLPLLG